MYVLRIESEEKKDLERAVEILRGNGINASIDSALKIVCFEEACSIVDNQYDHLNQNQRQELVDDLTDELYLSSESIFDEEYMNDLARDSAKIITES